MSEEVLRRVIRLTLVEAVSSRAPVRSAKAMSTGACHLSPAVTPSLSLDSHPPAHNLNLVVAAGHLCIFFLDRYRAFLYKLPDDTPLRGRSHMGVEVTLIDAPAMNTYEDITAELSNYSETGWIPSTVLALCICPAVRLIGFDDNSIHRCTEVDAANGPRSTCRLPDSSWCS